MTCYRCGTYLEPSDAFCPNCGTPTGVGVSRPNQFQGRNQTRLVIFIGAVLLLTAGVLVGVLVAGSKSDNGGAHDVAAGSATPATTPVREAQGSASVPPASDPVTSSSVTSASSGDFAAIYAAEQSGVVRIEVVGCSASDVGSGFLLSDTLVATAEHVVDEAVVVSLAVGDQHTTGRVIGSDPQTDLALVRADRPLTGFHFVFADQPARVGDRVAAIGFPIGGPISLTQGGVSGLDRSIPIDGTTRSGLMQTDAAINPGNSGGPLLGGDGKVVGLVDAKRTDASGIGFAIPAAPARHQLDNWEQSPQAQVTPSCGTPTGPDQPSDVGIPNLTPDVSAGVSDTFQRYFDGINGGDYRAAWLALSPRLRGGSLDRFAEGVSTSYDSDFQVLDAAQIDSSTVHVALQFISVQSADHGPNGDTCDVWHLVYTLTLSDGTWLIDGTRGLHGSTHDSC